MNELLDYAGADGWASMLKHEWRIPQFPFIKTNKKCVESLIQKQLPAVTVTTSW